MAGRGGPGAGAGAGAAGPTAGKALKKPAPKLNPARSSAGWQNKSYSCVSPQSPVSEPYS